jgi:two-component system NtrC family sensor kinase
MATAGTMLNRRILVIDDNPAIHTDFGRILQADMVASGLRDARAALFSDMPPEPTQEAFEVEFADQGQTGFVMVQKAIQSSRPYAVAFVDMRMPPGWDGVETLEHLWSVDPELQAVICTAFADLDWDRIIKRLGRRDQLLILRKPFDVVEVWQLARALTQKWSLARQAKHRLATLAELVDQRTQELRAANARLQRDIARRQQAEAALQQAHAELEQRVEERTAALQREVAERQRLEREAQRAEHFALLGRLAAGVSHEIRNPLGAVFLHVDLLAEALQDPSPDSMTDIAQALTEIRTNLARVDDLVQDYLSLARVPTIEKAPMDLGTLVMQFAQEMTPVLTAQRVTLHLDALDQLGTVALHLNTFRRVLLNLVQNALDAMSQGGTLTLRGRQQIATVHLDVCDTGIGIPPEHIARIFEPLHTTKPGGTGLRLYIVQEIITAHGGQVLVQSTVGHGTTFTITLPLAET